jgi:hypothetical protein
MHRSDKKMHRPQIRYPTNPTHPDHASTRRQETAHRPEPAWYKESYNEKIRRRKSPIVPTRRLTATINARPGSVTVNRIGRITQLIRLGADRIGGMENTQATGILQEMPFTVKAWLRTYALPFNPPNGSR